MVRNEVCTFDALNEDSAVFTNTKKEQYVVDIDTYFDKKVDEIKVGNYVTLEYDGREENGDGSFAPNVISISYLELEVNKLPIKY